MVTKADSLYNLLKGSEGETVETANQYSSTLQEI
jgi:hypothetical protein